jgi:hypothetical protein
LRRREGLAEPARRSCSPVLLVQSRNILWWNCPAGIAFPIRARKCGHRSREGRSWPHPPCVGIGLNGATSTAVHFCHEASASLLGPELPGFTASRYRQRGNQQTTRQARPAVAAGLVAWPASSTMASLNSADSLSRQALAVASVRRLAPQTAAKWRPSATGGLARPALPALRRWPLDHEGICPESQIACQSGSPLRPLKTRTCGRAGVSATSARRRSLREKTGTEWRRGRDSTSGRK